MKNINKIGKLGLLGALFLLVFAVLATLFSSVAFENLKNKNNMPTAEMNGKIFRLEIADNQDERSRGLGYRDNLCQDCGMLFVFPQRQRFGFWMKGMRFPLDIIWLAGDEVIYVAENVSPIFAGTITPDAPADKVLEINSGLSAKYGIKKGDRLILRNVQ